MVPCPREMDLSPLVSGTDTDTGSKRGGLITFGSDCMHAIDETRKRMAGAHLWPARGYEYEPLNLADRVDSELGLVNAGLDVLKVREEKIR